MTFEALALKYGRDTVAMQGLGPHFAHWIEGDAAVAYVDSGGAWVAAGSPLAAPDQLADVAVAFTAAAHEAGRRACFFAAEQPLVDAGLRAMTVGEQPVWRCAEWSQTLASAPSLRYQLARARNKGVTVRPLRAGDEAGIEAASARWEAHHAMPPMKFLVQLAPLDRLEERTVVVAERGGEIVGFGSAIPVPARDRLFVEHFVRAPEAPNGTVELVVDAVMRGCRTREVTLGLAPLAGDVSRWLRIARWLGSPLYGFSGLRAFKSKLRPAEWEPVYLCTTGGSTMVAMRDALRAFAGGSLVSFGARAMMRG